MGDLLSPPGCMRPWTAIPALALGLPFILNSTGIRYVTCVGRLTVSRGRELTAAGSRGLACVLKAVASACPWWVCQL